MVGSCRSYHFLAAPELVVAIDRWVNENGVAPDVSRPVKPIDNGLR